MNRIINSDYLIYGDLICQALEHIDIDISVTGPYPWAEATNRLNVLLHDYRYCVVAINGQTITILKYNPQNLPFSYSMPVDPYIEIDNINLADPDSISRLGISLLSAMSYLKGHGKAEDNSD